MSREVYQFEYDDNIYTWQTNNLARRMKEHRRKFWFNLFWALAEWTMKIKSLFKSDDKKEVDIVEKAEIIKSKYSGKNVLNKKI